MKKPAYGDEADLRQQDEYSRARPRSLKFGRPNTVCHPDATLWYRLDLWERAIRASTTTWALLSCVLLTACADAPGECSEATFGCDGQSGECWAHEPGWEASAQATTPEQVSAAVDAGELSPVEGDPSCWSLEVGNVCTLETSCSLLVGRPLQEVALESEACDAAGPWDYTAADAHHCLGVFGVLAVRLKQ